MAWGLASAWSAIGWRTPLAWLIVCGCVALAWRRFSLLSRLEPPPPRLLREELLCELGLTALPDSGDLQAALVAELNLRIADVSFDLGLVPRTYTALTRISLLSGSALALFGFIDSMAGAPFERGLRAAVCALSGLVGAGMVTAIGRSAKQRAEKLREAWDRASRETGKAFGGALERSGAPERS